jgi:hypothetical protein
MNVRRQIPTEAGLVLELSDGREFRWEGHSRWSRKNSDEWVSLNVALVPGTALHAAAEYVSQPAH